MHAVVAAAAAEARTMALAMACASSRLPSTGSNCLVSNSTLSNRFVRPRFMAASAEPRDGSNVATQEEPGASSPAEESAPSSSSSVEQQQQQQQQKAKGGAYYVDKDRRWDILGASLGFPLRFASGALAQGYKISLVPKEQVSPTQYSFYEIAGRKLVETSALGPRPEQPIQLYEFESCPFCRKVRELVSILDIDVLFYPCPKNGPTFRPKAFELGGKKQFPYMVDPNTGVSMYESDDIIRYLVQKYGNGKVPWTLALGPLTTITAGLAMIGRPGKGSTYVPAKKAEKPLELWAYELSPFCKLVRETLVELELPHVYHSTARGSPKRDELLKRTGVFQVPYLEDPNTGVTMFESSSIIEYLMSTYALT